MELNVSTWLIIGAIVIVFYLISAYNGLVVARQRVREGASDIDTQLKRRYDLIPNLIQTVKGYAAHEQATFEKVVEARAQAMNTNGLSDNKSQAENMLTDSLKSIFALSENYPELKANQNFLALQQELADTENKIQASRRFYNSVVLSLNTKVETFPTNLVAGLFKFNKENFFELEDSEREAAKKAPTVSF